MQAEQLREFLQDRADDFGPDTDDDRGVVLNRALIVATWLDSEGGEWVTWVSCNADGETASEWDVRGLLDHTRSHLDARMVASVTRDDSE